MRLFIITILSTAIAVFAEAKPMSEIIKSMPGAIAPYMTKDMLEELADNAKTSGDATVKNLLEETTRIDTITPDYAKIELNTSVTIQLKRLYTTSGDSIICLIRTFSAPYGESEVSLYTQDWVKTGDIDIASMAKRIPEKTEGITIQEYEKCLSAFNPALIEACLYPNDERLMVKKNAPMASKDEKVALAKINLQRFFKWDGTFFK